MFDVNPNIWNENIYFSISVFSLQLYTCTFEFYVSITIYTISGVDYDSLIVLLYFFLDDFCAYQRDLNKFYLFRFLCDILTTTDTVERACFHRISF